MFLGTHATRKKGEKDTPVETLFSDAEFIKSVQMGMAVETSSIPYDFCSLAYIDNIKTEQSWFALVRLSSSQLATKEYIVFDTVGKKIPACEKFRSFMLNKLKQYKAVVPNGYLKQESDCAVFWLSYDRIIECTQEHYPDLRFEFKSDPEQVAQTYFKLVGDPFAQRDVWKKQYEEVCESILKIFSNKSGINNYGARGVPAQKPEAIEKEYLSFVREVNRAKTNESSLKTAVAKAKILEAKMSGASYYTGLCQITSESCLILYRLTLDTSYLEQANIWCDKSLKAKPENQLALRSKVLISMFEKNYIEAEKTYKSISQKEIIPQLVLDIGEIIQATYIQNKLSLTDMRGIDLVIESVLRSPQTTDPFLQSGLHIIKAEAFYTGRGDAVSAYAEMLQAFRIVEKEKHEAAVLNTMTYICLDPRVKKYDKALVYINLALEKSPGQQMFMLTKANVYIELGMLKDAKKILKYLSRKMPCETVYYTYARALYHSEKYTEAKLWIEKALKISQDELNSSYYAFVCSKLNIYDETVSAYEKAIKAHKTKQAREQINDVQGERLALLADGDNEDSVLLPNVYTQFINFLCLHNNLAKAREVLSDAKETLPDRHEWILAETSIAKAELAEVEQRRAESEKQRADTESQRADAEKHQPVFNSEVLSDDELPF